MSKPGGFLIVDDVSINIFITEEMLSPYGAPIDSATSGAEAVEKIKSGNIYDIIFMDHMMPGMNGVEATKLIRSMGYTGCIVALTANEHGINDQLYIDSGFNRFITKPIDEDLLDDIINSYVDLDEYDGDDSTDTEVVPSSDELSEVERCFLVDAKGALQFLEKMFAVPHQVTHEEMEAYETTVHGMKSALNNIGNTKLGMEAYELEQAAKYGDYTIIFEDTPGFITELKNKYTEVSAKAHSLP